MSLKNKEEKEIALRDKLSLAQMMTDIVRSLEGWTDYPDSSAISPVYEEVKNSIFKAYNLLFGDGESESVIDTMYNIGHTSDELSGKKIVEIKISYTSYNEYLNDFAIYNGSIYTPEHSISSIVDVLNTYFDKLEITECDYNGLLFNDTEFECNEVFIVGDDRHAILFTIISKRDELKEVSRILDRTTNYNFETNLDDYTQW